MAERIAVNVGGRIFLTSKQTLKSSSVYFSALLRTTGDATSSRQEISEDIFIDRDPDLFADVLLFMRTTRLPAATLLNIARIRDVRAEAEFFEAKSLIVACDEAARDFGVLSTARTVGITLDDSNVQANIQVPTDQILYIHSATCVTPSRDGSFFSFSTYVSGDMRLECRLPSHEEDGLCRWTTLTHLLVNTLQEVKVSQAYRQDLRVSLSGDVTFDPKDVGLVRIRKVGSASWHLVCWIGPARAIPYFQHPFLR